MNKHNKSMIIKLRIVLILTFLSYFNYSALAQSNLKDTLLLDPRVKQGILPNGFQYFILNDNRPESTVDFTFIVRAGFLDEDPDQHGLSHLVEHLGMRASRNFPKGVKRFFEGKGLYHGGHFNANTTPEKTAYYVKIPSGNPELLASTFKVVLDWADGLSFNVDEIDEERAAVIRELTLGLTPAFANKYRNEFLQLNENPLYKDYRRRDIETVRSAPVSSIVRFYKEWYHPVNQALIITGNLDENEIELMIKETFSTLSNKGSRTRDTTAIKAFDITLSGENRLIVEDIDANSFPGINVRFYKKKKSSMKKPCPSTVDDFRAQLIYQLGQYMMANRLKVMDTEEKLQLITVDNDPIHVFAGVDAISAFGSRDIYTPRDAKAFIDLVATEMRRLALFGFVESEFGRAKDRLLKSLEESSTFSVPKIDGYYLDGCAFLLPERERKLRKELLSDISLPDVNTMFVSWLASPGNMDIVISTPSNGFVETPTKQDFFSSVDRIFKSKLSPYKDVNPTKGLPTLSFNQKSNAYERTEIKELAVTKVAFPNGVTIFFKPLDNPGNSKNELMVRGINTSHAEISSLDNMEVSGLLSNMESFIGVAGLTPKEISKWENELSGSPEVLFVSPVINNYRAGIAAGATDKNIESMLRLMYGYFMESRIDETAFKEVQQQFQKEKFVTSRDKLENAINNLINGVPNQSSASEEKQKSYSSPAKIESILKEQFKNAGQFTFVVIGSFNLDSVIPLFVKYLGALKGKPSVVSVNGFDNQLVQKIRDREITLVGDSIGNVDVRILIEGSDNATAKNKLIRQILSNVATSVLMDRLRVKEKGIYGMTVSSRLCKDPLKLFLDISFETAPSDVQRLVNATLDEIRKLSDGSIDSIIFKNAKERVRERIVTIWKTPGFWDQYLSDQVRKGKMTTEDLPKLDILDMITADDLSRYIRENVNVDQYYLFKLL